MEPLSKSLSTAKMSFDCSAASSFFLVRPLCLFFSYNDVAASLFYLSGTLVGCCFYYCNLIRETYILVSIVVVLRSNFCFSFSNYKILINLLLNYIACLLNIKKKREWWSKARVKGVNVGPKQLLRRLRIAQMAISKLHHFRSSCFHSIPHQLFSKIPQGPYNSKDPNPDLNINIRESKKDWRYIGFTIAKQVISGVWIENAVKSKVIAVFLHKPRKR